MKSFIFSIVAILFFSAVAAAWDNNSGKGKGQRSYEDAWGNNYKKQQNMWKDTDKDGVINYYDYNDRNRNIQNPYQSDYDKKGYGTGKNKW